MSLTDRYVTATAGGAGDGTEGNPWTLTQAFASAVAGDRVNIKSGTYARTTTVDAPANDGSATQPIIYRGVDSSWNEIIPHRNSGNLLLDTSSYPNITYTTGRLNGATSNAHIFQCLKIDAACAAAAAYVCGTTIVYGCSITNTSTSTSAQCLNITSDTGNVCGGGALMCDFFLAGSDNANCGAVFQDNPLGKCIGCYITGSNSRGIVVAATSLILGNVISGCSSYGISGSSLATYHMLEIIGNTIIGGGGIYLSDTAYTALQLILGNIIVDTSGFAITNPNATGSCVLLAFNRTRDNTSGAISWNGDWDIATTWQHVTAASTNAAEFVDPTGTPKNLNLQSTSPARGTSYLPYLDIGALQRQEPTLPSAENKVYVGIGYGDYINGAYEFTGTMPGCMVLVAT